MLEKFYRLYTPMLIQADQYSAPLQPLQLIKN